MPNAARMADSTGHGTPLAPGPGCLTVLIGGFPAWRALPSGMANAVEPISNKMDGLMKRPQLTPPDVTPTLVEICEALAEGAVKAVAAGALVSAATAASQVVTLTAANVALTAVWVAASAVPGGAPAATFAYTQGIKIAAAVAASAVMASMASLSDMHVCPVPVPIPPHGPGFVPTGSGTVIIGNLGAARQGDKLFEACGGSVPIAMGCPTVQIGD